MLKASASKIASRVTNELNMSAAVFESMAAVKEVFSVERNAEMAP